MKNETCSGYLKDKSLSLKYVSALGKPKERERKSMENFDENKKKLTMNNLFSVFLMLPGKNHISTKILIWNILSVSYGTAIAIFIGEIIFSKIFSRTVTCKDALFDQKIS